MPSVIMLNGIMLSVIFAMCRQLKLYSECHYDECHYGECRKCTLLADCHYAKFYIAERHFCCVTNKQRMLSFIILKVVLLNV
jgi:hypothetical protein